MIFLAGFVALFVTLIFGPATAQPVLFKNFSEVRVTGPISREMSSDSHALIIYNSAYDHDGISDLPVTENDAKAIQKLFEGMGYPAENIKVIANGDKDTLEEQVLFFASTLTRDSSVVIYYSGHGISFDDDPSNYIDEPAGFCPERKGQGAAVQATFGQLQQGHPRGHQDLGAARRRGLL